VAVSIDADVPIWVDVPIGVYVPIDMDVSVGVDVPLDLDVVLISTAVMVATVAKAVIAAVVIATGSSIRVIFTRLKSQCAEGQRTDRSDGVTRVVHRIRAHQDDKMNAAFA
jgi:hypothetical protein